jgi:FAD:protein FMN transferase
MRALLSLGIFILILAHIPAFSDEPALERQQYQMGTYARVLIYGGSNEQADRAFSEISRLDNLLSDYNSSSEISEINRQAGKKPVNVSPHVSQILKISKQVAEETGGEFDPTIGALTIGVYRFGRDGESNITETEIERARSLVDYKLLTLDGDTAYLEKEGMMLDLGGIGKGFAIDKAAQALKEEGVTKAMVSLSGDIRVFGKDVTMGIKHPDREGSIAKFRTGTHDLAISTSGGYERTVTSDGKTYHHLIVPETGRPGEDFLSVTVLLKGNNTLADAYATALFVMGKERAVEFLAKHPEIGVFIVYPGGGTYHNKAFTELTKDIKVDKNMSAN